MAAEQLRPNKGQWQAYESNGHAIILAGPGSGKTKTLTTKLARMLAEDVRRPQGIACITFNNECVRELRHRLSALGVDEGPNVFIGTVHSFCLQAVVMPYARLAGEDVPDGVTIAGREEQTRVVAAALAKTISADERPESWLDRVTKHKQAIRDSDNLEAVADDEQVIRLLAAYTKGMRSAKQIDFDDIVIIGRRLIESNRWIQRALAARFPVLVVDEYQDLGLSLHRIVLALVNGGGSRLVAVGDPDQSIYGFQGARPELLLRLAEEVGVDPIKLRLNYRSGSRIVTASEVALGETRGYEASTKERGSIDFHKCDGALEGQAACICDTIIPAALARREGRVLGDIAVLYSTKYIGDVIAERARASGFEFVRSDQNALYRATPLTRWMEECAAWCAGGWESGTPRLSHLIQTWHRLNRSCTTDSQRRGLKLDLVRFLMSHREGERPLRDWLGDFYSECLDASVAREPLLTEERDVLDDLLELTQPRGGFEKSSVASFAGQGGSDNHLNLMTLHNAKGLEFDVVVMMGMDQGIIPSYMAQTPDAKREPRRLFYVGLTRARHEVHMTFSGYTVDRYKRRHENGPSEFLVDLRRRLDEQESI